MLYFLLRLNRKGCSFSSFFLPTFWIHLMSRNTYSRDMETSSEVMFTGFKQRAQTPLNQASLTPHRTATQTTQEVGEAREGSDSERQLWRGASRKDPCPTQSTVFAPLHTQSQESFTSLPKAHTEETPYSNFLKKERKKERKGEGGGGSKQLLGFRGEDLKAQRVTPPRQKEKWPERGATATPHTARRH